MKEYLKKNLEPILIGYVVAVMILYVLDTIGDTIIKLALIK
jgi:hypothetical protein